MSLLNQIKAGLVIGLSGLVLSGCATTNTTLTRVGIEGRTEAYKGTVNEINGYLSSPKGWGFNAWDIYNEGKHVGVYAEGRPYGMHFYELSTDSKLFDGNWTDGPKNLPIGYEAVPRKAKKNVAQSSPPPFILL